jgi:hypothetical protein
MKPFWYSRDGRSAASWLLYAAGAIAIVGGVALVSTPTVILIVTGIALMFAALFALAL